MPSADFYRLLRRKSTPEKPMFLLVTAAIVFLMLLLQTVFSQVSIKEKVSINPSKYIRYSNSITGFDNSH
jgi:hypothetical protein